MREEYLSAFTHKCLYELFFVRNHSSNFNALILNCLICTITIFSFLNLIDENKHNGKPTMQRIPKSLLQMTILHHLRINAYYKSFVFLCAFEPWWRKNKTLTISKKHTSPQTASAILRAIPDLK